MRLSIKCPYCGSANIQTTGGDNGDPFNQLPCSAVCLDCGRTIQRDEAKPASTIPDITKPRITLPTPLPTIHIFMTSDCKGVHNEASVDIPYADGEHLLIGCGYPVSRYEKVIIRGDTIELDGDVSKLSTQALITEKQYTVYAVDKTPWLEKVNIRIEIIRR